MEQLQEDYDWLKDQIAVNEKKIDDVKNLIEENKLHKEHLIENRNLLLENIKLKMQEQKDKIQQLSELEKTNKNNLKLIEKPKYEFDGNKITKLLDFITNHDSQEVVESLIDTYRNAKNQVMRIYEKEKFLTGEEINFISINYETDIVNFRVNDEYYSFNDLLKDICRYYDLKITEYRFFDSDQNQVLMILSVKKYIEIKKAKSSQGVSNIYLKCILSENLNIMNDNNKNELILKQQIINVIETGDIITNIEDIEDDLLEKIGKIIMYLMFLMMIYIYLITKYQIPAIYLINTAIKNQVYYVGFYKQNKFGLENNLQNLVNVKDIYYWMSEVFTNSFNLYDNNDNITNPNQNNSNIDLSTFLDNYLFLGKIRFLQILQDSTEANYTFALKINEYGNYFKNYTKPLKKSSLNTQFIYVGSYDTYSVSDAYYVDTQASLIENFIYFALFRNVDWINSNTKFFALIFNGLNYNMDLVISVTYFYFIYRLVLEQNSVGRIQTNYKVCVLNVIQDLKYFINFSTSFMQEPLSVAFNLGAMFTIYLYCFIGIFSIVRNIISENRLSYILYYWNWIYILNVSVFLCANLLRMYLLVVLKPKLAKIPTDFLDLSSECNLSQYMELGECVMLSLCLIYFLQYLDKNIIGPIFETLLKSFKNVVVFILSYCFIIIGFTFFANFVYGIYILKFVDLTTSCINLFFMIFGDFSLITNMSNVFPNLTITFIIGFGFSFYILFGNWLTATIMHSYTIHQRFISTERERTGTIIVNLIDEIVIIYRKMWRSGLIFIYRMKKKIKEIIDLRKKLEDLLNKKKRENVKGNDGGENEKPKEGEELEKEGEKEEDKIKEGDKVKEN